MWPARLLDSRNDEESLSLVVVWLPRVAVVRRVPTIWSNSEPGDNRPRRFRITLQPVDQGMDDVSVESRSDDPW